MGEEEGKKEKRVVGVESLGWLTESTIMPKKHRAISGVGASSILELKAELYKYQEEFKSSKQLSAHPDHLEYQRAKNKIDPHDSSHKNSGVEARNIKDKLELKAVNDGSASYAALEKKAELYDKLARGELSDEEDKEKYCVDFFRKGVLEDESQQPLDHNASATESAKAEDDENDHSLPFAKPPTGLGRTAGTMDSNEHKRFVWEVHEEANQAREKASELKLRRQEQAATRREKLKKAYLQKQLEKLKAAQKTEET